MPVSWTVVMSALVDNAVRRSNLSFLSEVPHPHMSTCITNRILTYSYHTHPYHTNYL